MQELEQRNTELEIAKQEAAVAKNNLEVIWKQMQKTQLANAGKSEVRGGGEEPVQKRARVDE